jgi:hypothetical protein
MIIFVNRKQKRVPRPPTVEGLPVDEFIARHADPLWLHQNEMWESMPDSYADQIEDKTEKLVGMIVPWHKPHKSPRTTDFPVRRTALIDRLEVRRTGMGEPPRSIG